METETIHHHNKKNNKMKYLDLEALGQLVQFTDRANGKSTEAITEALNILMRSNDTARVLFVTARQQNSEAAQKAAKGILSKFAGKYDIRILRESRGILAFNSFNGNEKVLNVCDTRSAALTCRGNSYDDVIIDVELNTLFGVIDPMTFETLGSQLFKTIAPIIRKN